jgi:hypothetical protein
MALNTTPPTAPTEVPADIANTGVTTPEAGSTPQAVSSPEVPPTGEQPVVDEFFDTFNKRYSTTYKTNDEIKGVLATPLKIADYEKRLSDFEVTKKSVEEYKKKIEELEGSFDPLKFFSSPETYVAEQLRIKYPKSNPVLLQEIATTDVNNMGDFDVLVKEKQLFVQNAPKEGVIRSIVLKKYGIDPTIPPEEWDELAKGEMQLDAATAREKINGLKGVIEMPKVITKEQRETEAKNALIEKEKVLTPLKQDFLKFDKFSHEGFEFDVPEEYKSKLPDMFQAMFINAGMEATPENLQSMVELREALFLRQYFPKIKEVIAKEAETKLQTKIDAELHNTQPPNTTTATDQGNVNPFAGKGLDQYLQDQKKRR